MTDNEKMTDNEIIKELNLRIDDFSRETLDLIKRQKAEIERLNVELKAMRGSANSYKLENERLQKNIDGLNIFTKNHIKVIRLQAIKEFANRLKNKIKTECNPYGKPTFDYDTSLAIMCYIDNLVKEMTEVETNQRKEDEEK